MIKNVTKRSAKAICYLEEAADTLNDLKDLGTFKTEEELKLWLQAHDQIKSAEQILTKVMVQDLEVLFSEEEL